jgi:hypothetical protein
MQATTVLRIVLAGLVAIQARVLVGLLEAVLGIASLETMVKRRQIVVENSVALVNDIASIVTMDSENSHHTQL